MEKKLFEKIVFVQNGYDFEKQAVLRGPFEKLVFWTKILKFKELELI